MLLAVDLHEYLVDIKCIAIPLMPTLQPLRVDRAKLDAPKTNRFPSHDDASLSQEILDITMAQVEAIVEPDGVASDVCRESVAPISIHRPILSIWPS